MPPSHFDRDELDFAARCLAHDPVALRVLEREYLQQTDGVLARIGLSPSDRDEVRQMVWMRLVMGERPKLALYAGSGSLLAFVRAVALRVALDHRRLRTGVEIDEWTLLGIPDASDGPELSVMKRLSRAQFRRAFESALSALSVRQRTLLRQTYVDGLSTESVAHLHGTHRTTVFRWLVEARRVLEKHLRREIAQALRLPDDEIPPFAAFLESQLTLSLPVVLA
jgi:RNA polymerase sigma-70 factor (ECF subfamily)